MTNKKQDRKQQQQQQRQKKESRKLTKQHWTGEYGTGERKRERADARKY